MQTVNEINVQVPPDVAEAYRQSSEQERQQLALQIGAILRQNFPSPDTYLRLQQTMNKVAAEAHQNGLTPEILASLLHDE
jgi:chorismate mutase